MSATMARQGSQVQPEPSDKHLALKMAIIANEAFSRDTIEETQYLTETPRTEV